MRGGERWRLHLTPLPRAACWLLRMGKKGRNTAAEPTAATPVVSRDSLQRLSYLYQASVLLNSALAGAAEDAAGKRKGGKRRRLSNEGAGPVGDEKEVSKGDQLMKDKDGEDATSEVQKAGEATERPHKRIRSRSDGLQPVAQRVAREMKEVAKKATVRMYVRPFSALQALQKVDRESTGTRPSSGQSVRGARLSSFPALPRLFASSVRTGHPSLFQRLTLLSSSIRTPRPSRRPYLPLLPSPTSPTSFTSPRLRRARRNARRSREEERSRTERGASSKTTGLLRARRACRCSRERGCEAGVIPD